MLKAIEKKRGFQPPWYYVYIYQCDKCKTEYTIRKNWHGEKPKGGFQCDKCGATIIF